MKFIEKVYILALVACFTGNCACISSGTSVTNITTYRYHVAVICPVSMCNGAIVSLRNVVTTASCVNNLSPENVDVYAGSVRYYDGGITYSVTNIVMHPSYNRATFDSNIAILTVGSPFDTNQPIPLASAAPPTNKFVKATSYGAIDTSFTLPDVLQEVDLKAFSFTYCQSLKNNRLTKSMFCAGDEAGKKDFCPADQGAPATLNKKLVGIYSWGSSCGLAAPDPSSPVFISIPYFRKWIQKNAEGSRTSSDSKDLLDLIGL